MRLKKVLITLIFTGMLFSAAAWAGIQTVTTTADAGAGSLRQAIINAANYDTIAFSISDAYATTEGGLKRWRINLASALNINKPVYIDGTTQPTIEIRGTGTSGIDGFDINTSNCTVEDLVVNNFRHAFYISGSSYANNRIIGNYIGTACDGETALGNSNGVYIFGGAHDNEVGGPSAAERNIISGNSNYGVRISNGYADNNKVINNFIGTNKDGSSAIPNLSGIRIDYARYNKVGGATETERNVISGNTSYGVWIGNGSSNEVKGNYIGTDASGTTNLANNIAVYLSGAANPTFNNIIGGTLETEKNVISGNTNSGIVLTDAIYQNKIIGNYIGTDKNGTADLGNGYHGIIIDGGAYSNKIGPRNIIAYNGNSMYPYGIYIQGVTSDYNLITQNSIFENFGLGIALNGGNDQISAPTILIAASNETTGSTEVSGSGAGVTATVEVFATNGPDPSGSGEGKVYLGSTIADASGNWIATLEALTNGTILSSTTTHTDNNTSMFSINGIVGDPYTVYNTNNSGPGSLRQAILNANAAPGRQTIKFEIPTAEGSTEGTVSWWCIAPTSALPIITDEVHIDGTTQPTNETFNNPYGPEIEIDGTAAGSSHGINITTSNCTIEGLVINNFSASGRFGIYINGTGANNNRVIGNYIGTDISGEVGLGNNRGVYINTASSNEVGGTLASQKNLISGNTLYGIGMNDASYNKVIGNYIGTDRTGTASLSNGIGVYISAPSNQSAFNKIERNLISGNSNYGIEIMDPDSSSNEVKGNYIGTDINGTTALGNGQHGVYIYYRTFDNYIGGSLSGEGNVISGNIDAGIFIEGGSGQPVNNKIIGNYIGTDVYGTAIISNEVGVQIEDGFGTIIGGTIEAEGNIISGNRQYGIAIGGDKSSSGPGNTVQWNYIGTNANNNDLGNAIYGIYISTSDNARVGPNNIIAYNDSDGVHLEGIPFAASNTLITQNSMFNNIGKGISLETGANNYVPYPVITSMKYITGSTLISGTATPDAIVEIFKTEDIPDASGQGEGKVFLGSTEAHPISGTWEIVSTDLSKGDKVTATVTDTNNNTSEFALNGTVESGAVEIISLSISREANDLIISWTTSPESGAVDIYRIATTDATSDIYTNEATPAWIIIITGETFSSTKEINEIGGGYAQAYYKVISTGQTDSFATAEAVGKFNKAVPVGLSLFSVPILPTDTDINVAIGDQLSNNDVIYYFTGTAWQDSTTNGSTWTGGVTDIYPDLGYWVRVQTTPSTVTVWGDVYNAASREVSLASGLNLKGTAYPIRVTLEDSDLGAALSYGSGTDTGTLYYFTGSAWQDSSWNGSSWYNKGISYFYPTRGYWIRRNNSGSSNWYYPKLY